MIRLLPIPLLFFGLILMQACKTAPIGPDPVAPGTGGPVGPGSPDPADTSLCFERDILPIFITNCARSGCHDAASRRDGYVFTSYETITAKKFKAGNARETELYEKIREHEPDDRMPPPPNPPLGEAQIALIGRWIDEGAENSTGCAIPCDSNGTAFSADIQPILNTYCKGCHSSAAPSAGVVLDTYAGARSVALNGRLFGSISHSAGFSAMPQGGAKLSDCSIAKIRGWIQRGAPDN